MAALRQLTLTPSSSSSTITPLPSQFQSYFHFRRRRRLLPSASTARASPPPQQTNAINRRQLIGLHAAAAISLSPLGKRALAGDELLSEWERVYLPIDPGVVLLDIAFVPDDPSHGFLLGTRQTILETKDGGNTWASRSIPSAEDEDFNYRFNSISFRGKEGWIVGKPAILLYTADAGDTWQRIPLSAQLPGDMHHHGDGSSSSSKEERLRFFDSKTKSMCWNKAKQVPGRDPDRWRIDAAGNIVCKCLHSCQGCLCYEYDHIIPFSRGGQSVVENCQILHVEKISLNISQNSESSIPMNGSRFIHKLANNTNNKGDIWSGYSQVYQLSNEASILGFVLQIHFCLLYPFNITARNQNIINVDNQNNNSHMTITYKNRVIRLASIKAKCTNDTAEFVKPGSTVSSGISGASYYTGTFSTVNRSPEGKYVAVSSRGNFYLTWEPGQTFWQPHNRAVARRIQSMGWRADGGLWLLVRGGGLYLSKGTGITEEFEEVPVQSRGFGILDVGYRSQEEAWAAGGSGILLKTTNSGKSWIRDKAADNIAANLYSVKFINGKQGFVLGNDGVLLKYLG
ncbi:hypothetical protein CDL12_06147 [Handroanthus impetiginosus]|nr:hypothetical protein CDL12_06147 [Handroanthus impetiginosus]